MITITHTHAEGTLADGTSKGDSAGDILKGYGFRWMPSLEMFGINHTRDRAAKRRALNRALTALVAAGFEAELTIDDTPRDYETVQRAAGERLKERRTRLAQRGQQAADRSAALLRRSDERVGEVPMGQPLAAGRRGRWLSKAKAGAGADLIEAGAAAREADQHNARVRASQQQEEHRARLDVIARRTVRVERELRAIDRHLQGQNDVAPATGLYAQELEAQRAVALIQLNGDRAVLESARLDSGGWSKSTVHRGDGVFVRGFWYTVVRANPKTVSVETGASWSLRYGYAEISEVKCSHPQESPNGQSTRKPKRRAARPRPAPKPADRPHTEKQLSCADGAQFVEITRFLLTSAAARLTCGCGLNHWAKAIDGDYRTAAAVPVELVEQLIGTAGYQVAGAWYDHAIKGEFAHTSRRARVRRIPGPRGRHELAQILSEGEHAHHWRPDRWTLTLADGARYEIAWNPGQTSPFTARPSGTGQHIGATADWASALDLIREHATSAQGKDGAATG